MKSILQIRLENAESIYLKSNTIDNQLDFDLIKSVCLRKAVFYTNMKFPKSKIKFKSIIVTSKEQEDYLVNRYKFFLKQHIFVS